MTLDAAMALDAPLEDLMGAASAKRDDLFGPFITYSPKVFIPLTMLCRDRCGYCTFAKAPAHLESPYLDIDRVLAIARQGQEQGCTEALFTLGARTWVRKHGFVPRGGHDCREGRDRAPPPCQRWCFG